VRILSVVHQPDAGSGVFGQASLAAGHELVEWLVPEQPAPELAGIHAAMVFGGAMHVDQEDANPWMRPEKALLRELIARRVPTLGVCLGCQLLAEAAGAAPRRACEPEIGWLEIDLLPEAVGDPLLGALPERFEGFQWHSYETPLPPGAVPLARSPVCLQAFRLAEAPAWGVQFHPEVTKETLDGWLDDYASDPDALRTGVDPESIRAQSETRIAPWNELGRAIAHGFLAAAAAAAGARGGATPASRRRPTGPRRP
jgi:GMP synthase-like glutamine amidotransferase